MGRRMVSGYNEAISERSWIELDGGQMGVPFSGICGQSVTGNWVGRSGTTSAVLGKVWLGNAQYRERTRGPR
jgi:hypothetical protein